MSDTSVGESSAPDWRTLLDLLETRTSASYADLWREWVVRPEERAMLDDRAAARAAYAAAVAEAGDWELPRDIRTALDRWQFDDATAFIARARALLAARPGLESKAASAGLSLPSTLRIAFERDGPAAAEPELAAETAAIDRIAADAEAEPADPGIVARIGLLGEHPEVRLAEARTTFASGDLTGAVAAADAARVTWLSATDVGRGRLATAAFVLALIGIALLATSRRGRRRQRTRGSGPGSSRLPMARAVRAGEQDRDGPDPS